jgi:hypothetical protein
LQAITLQAGEYGLGVCGIHHPGSAPIVQHPQVIVWEGRQRN